MHLHTIFTLNIGTPLLLSILVLKFEKVHSTTCFLYPMQTVFMCACGDGRGVYCFHVHLYVHLYVDLICNFSLSLKTPKWQRIRDLSDASFCVCLFVLQFYGPVNPMESCRAWSVYLTTHLLGRLSPLSG